MCIACELELFLALDQPPPAAAEPDARFACDVPPDVPADAAPAKAVMDERKP